jgi:hypothetical protein
MSEAKHRFDNDLRYRSEKHPWQIALTPPYVLDPVRADLGGIELDPCTTETNPVGADRFYAPPQDGLALPWDARTIFCNPPYGKAREPWVRRCIDAANAGAAVILLMPAHTDTRIFHEVVASDPEILFVKGRLKFGILRPNLRQVAASHPSALFCWGAEMLACAHLGSIVRRS